MTTLLTKEIILSQLDSTEEFPIALSDAWEWLGYSRKDPAIKSFKSLGFDRGLDYETSEDRSRREVRVIVMDDNSHEDCEEVFHLEMENSTQQGFQSKGGRPKTPDLFMTIDTFKTWGLSAQTERGREIRAMYIRIEKEWRLMKAYQARSSQGVTSEDVQRKHVKAAEWQDGPFSSFEKEEPEAAEVVKHWNYLEVHKKLPKNLVAPTEVQALTPSEPPQRIIPNSSEFLPDPEAQKMIESLLEIIDSLGLAANRAGLAGNKSIKEAEFLAKQLENVRELFEGQESKLKRLNDALKDSEVLIAGKDAEIEALQKALKLAQSNSDMAGAKLEGHEMLRHAHKVEVAQLKAQIRDLKAQLHLQTPSIGSSSDPGDLPGLPPAR